MRASDQIFSLAATIREYGNALVLKMLEEQGVRDLLPAHGAVLYALFTYGPLQMNVLAELIGRKKNTITSLVSTLGERGYCVREQSEDDGRVHRIRLTEKGESLRTIHAEISERVVSLAWEGISTKERESCAATLQKVIANLERE